MYQVKEIWVPAKNTVEYRVAGEMDFSDLGECEVLVQTKFTTVSAGTEKASITGARVGAGQPVVFPRYIGYSSAGKVVKVGANVKNFKVGDRVAAYWTTHKNYNVLPQDRLVKIPDNVSYAEAAEAFIATFPLAAIRKVKLEIGESMLVMGLGILGQFAVRLARAAGAAPIIVADPIAERREEALKGGADYAFDPLEKDFAEKVKAITGGGVKTAIEVTGVGAGLNETLDCMAKFGRVALLGCTRDSNFSVDYYEKVHCPGITLVGAHTNARAEKESSHGNFTHNDDIAAILNLCSCGRMELLSLIKETHSPKDCQDVYNRLVNGNFPIGIQFDWAEEI